MLQVSLYLLALLAQAPAPAPQVAEPPAPEPVAPYAGSVSEGLSALRAAVSEGSRDDVVALAAQVAAAAREREVLEPRRARVLHDTGLARARVGDLEGALADLRMAAGLAGPGEARASALYAAGTAQLVRAEELRQAVPEIAKTLGLPVPPAPEEQEGPDPLAVAREAYLAARAGLCDRLALDWRHEDTRANLELVTRRLRELENIEREREQQKQQQQDQKPSPDQEQKPQDSQQEPKDGEQETPPKEEPKDPKEGEQEEPQEQEQAPEPEPKDEQKTGEPQPQQVEERVLSKEEVQRLLDQLAQIDEQARAVQARLRERKRKPVEKDW